jgi:uncharacterized protein YcfJ
MKLSKYLASIAVALPLTAFGSNAVVVKSTPVYENFRSTEEVCRMETVKNNSAGVIGTVVGAALGLAIANQLPVVSSAHETITRITMGVGGGALGHKLTKEQEIERCYPETVIRSNLIGYDVVFQVNGRNYTQRMNYDPGVGSTHRATMKIQ